MIRFPLRYLLPLVTIAPVAQGQTVIAPHSNGPLVGVSSMFSLASETSGIASGDGASTGLFKSIGFADTAPVALDAATSIAVPDFSAKALFRAPCSIPSAALPDVDAHSLGLDWITVERGGLVRVPAGNWSGLAFSVTRSSRGTGGQIAGEVARTDANAKAGADVFSFIYRGSALPPPVVDVTQRSNDANEIRVPGSLEIDAIDLYAPLYRLAAELALKIPVARYYFSVSKESLGLVPPAWWNGKPKSGATIFESKWDSTTKKWSCPKGVFAPKDLGLTDDEDVDAFSYDSVQGKIVLSTRTAARNPLLYVDASGPQAAVIAVPVVYATTPPVPVTDSIGMDSVLDDIDSICSYDPGAAGGVRLEFVLGRLVGASPPVPLALEVQTYLDVDARNPAQRALRFFAVGGHPGGFGLLFLAPPNSAQFFSPLAPLGIPNNAPFFGAPIGAPIRVPPNLGNLQFDSAWLTIGPVGPGQFKISHRLRTQTF